MKQAAWGALATVLALTVAFFLGRASVPDRTAEVARWRDSAAAVGRETAAVTAAWAAAQVHARQMEARADSAIQRVAAVQGRSLRRDSALAVLRDSLAVVTTLADTAGLQAVIIAQQDTVIRDLRTGMAEAWEALVGFREDAAVARETLHTAHAENARLRGIIAAGLDATKPSRGTGSTVKAVALGIALGVVGWEVVR